MSNIHYLNASIDIFILFLQPDDTGPLIEIIDACFGFVRKKSAGTSFSNPKFETRMFADQDDVDNFILQHSKDIKKSENVITHFLATSVNLFTFF